MWREISREFSDYISPIKGYIMIAVIGVISLITTYLGFEEFGLIKTLPVILRESVLLLVSIFVFLFLSWCYVAIKVIFRGEDIVFPKGKSKMLDFHRRHQDDNQDVSEVPISLPVVNRNKHLEILCHATIEKFEWVMNEDGFSVDDETTKHLRNYNLLKRKVPRLTWFNPEYQTAECEMKIPPQSERVVEVAKFRFLLKQSLDANKPVGNIGLYYCKNEDTNKPFDQLPLGLYSISIAINYKRDGEVALRTKRFNGYIFVSIRDDRSGWNMAKEDIRDRLMGRGIIDTGDPMKNNDIPKPREKDYKKKPS